MPNTTVTLSQRDNLDKQDTQKADDTKVYIVVCGTGAQNLSYTTAHQVKPHVVKNAYRTRREDRLGIKKEHTSGDALIQNL